MPKTTFTRPHKQKYASQESPYVVNIFRRWLGIAVRAYFGLKRDEIGTIMIWRASQDPSASPLNGGPQKSGPSNFALRDSVT